MHDPSFLSLLIGCTMEMHSSLEILAGLDILLSLEILPSLEILASLDSGQFIGQFRYEFRDLDQFRVCPV